MATGNSFVAPAGKRLSAETLDFVFLGCASIVVAAIYDPNCLEDSRFAMVVAGVYVAYHAGFLYAWRGQTPGKRTLDIQVISMRMHPLVQMQCVGRPLVRMLLMILATIFAIQTSVWMAAVFPLIAELALQRSPLEKATIADMLCGTRVINLPPVQPHRAPAGPMYSATDAEFGVRPRKIK